MPKTVAAVVGALAVFLVSIGTAAKAEPVDIQLALIVDVSRSVDNEEFRLGGKVSRPRLPTLAC